MSTQFGNNLDNFSLAGGNPWAYTAQWGSPPAANAVQMDPYQAAYMQRWDRSLDLQGQQIDVARQASAPLSGFQQGVQTFGTITQGLASLANIYMGMKGLKQQKEAFNFNKGVVNTNLGNAITDYNRRLGDTLANRALNNGQGQGWVSQQLAQYQAKRSG